ncbi:CBS domain-containing protein [Candidatus Albibeggiatoa sp. nov. BB20]|uniref:CBS domain-containing protein n=1 Tax=Candidatus Albibeggiatoa sp. nov. BB20 TaxID=3162723 RepID=UPI003365A532
MAYDDNLARRGQNLRDTLAIGITLTSIVGVIILSLIVIMKDDDGSNITMVFTAVLPLMGSWIGTVLAYYFSKDNFEAATRSVSEMARNVSPQEKLKSTAVKDTMIKRDQMFYKKAPLGGLMLIDILDELTGGEWSRLPVLNDSGHIESVIHRSDIDRYMAERLRRYPATDLSALTLQDMLSEYSDLESHFGVISEKSTLADAKSIMDKVPNCKDVFVTVNGKQNEDVIGWVTNAIIAANAQV